MFQSRGGAEGWTSHKACMARPAIYEGIVCIPSCHQNSLDYLWAILGCMVLLCCFGNDIFCFHAERNIVKYHETLLMFIFCRWYGSLSWCHTSSSIFQVCRCNIRFGEFTLKRNSLKWNSVILSDMECKPLRNLCSTGFIKWCKVDNGLQVYLPYLLPSGFF